MPACAAARLSLINPGPTCCFRNDSRLVSPQRHQLSDVSDSELDVTAVPALDIAEHPLVNPGPASCFCNWPLRAGQSPQTGQVQVPDSPAFTHPCVHAGHQSMGDPHTESTSAGLSQCPPASPVLAFVPPALGQVRPVA